ncbi:cysteine hydrolase [Bacillus haynesii]|uniref:cysteine hydrolase family protein n=1 Tax=Bacillus haynesii TaxID=1925021 RepID=UPI00227E3C72|nr:isochorismatase family cysteine hydrolase [Bacillus haynesii]MCY7768556.1 cysteine hydrolase [Bacillus haynesii]MCY8013391.1 cysteine hydrolase [Bacillus haynesii]MEC0718897.1 cysteine hydrolase [Bacillus haynesii]MEC0763830.1 cysteine hydrolase [Bacillus haynesii]MEC0782590.1 cysteine hydrolase [Bacillus haynesii]
MKKALICIDYTNDFVAADGKLTCGEPGRKIEDAVTRLAETFIQNGDYVVFAVDSHETGDTHHPETRLFPPHNIKGTSGQDLYGKLEALYRKHEHDQNVYYMEKTRYSAFAGTNLELKLRERDIKELHLVGVCTDICVLHTAVDAYNKGFNLVIHQNAVASFNPDGHDWALSHFANTLGASVSD